MEAGEIDDRDGLVPEQLRALQVRRDGPGLVRITVQLGGIALAAVLTLRADGFAWVLSVTAMGVLVATLFAPLHECVHRSAFASRALNEGVLWICAVFNLHVPTLFREFHFDHHRHTQDRARDPEIMLAPALLDPFPRDPLRYVLVACGQQILLGKVMFMLVGSFAPLGVRRKMFSYVHEAKHARVAWENRLMLAIVVATIALGLLYVPHFARLLLAWPISYVVLGLYLMAEHTGLPNDGTQNRRTRSITSNAVVRWLFWNMPLHAIHHMHPAIPFHAVPEAHRLAAPRLTNVVSGYLAFHREALAHAFGRR